MPSLCVEERLAPQLVCLVGGRRSNMLPGIIVSQEHAVILPGPPLAAVSPVDAGQVKYFPQGYQFIRLGYRLPGIFG